MTAAMRRRRVSSQDEERFAALYRDCLKPVHAYCARRLAAAQAADAVSEVFLVAWKKIDQVPEGGGALPWLYAVAYRVVSHQWRSKARNRRLLTRLGGVATMEPPSPDLVLLRREEDQLVIRAASRLRQADQEILRLTLWEELSHADVAVVLGIDAGAVKQRGIGPVAILPPNTRN